jgi:aminoglycoside phosphotransferase (APT) family kinase protein
MSGTAQDLVEVIARQHGVDPGQIRLAPRQGQVNLVYFLGADLVLRLPRPGVDHAVPLLSKEAAVIPAARAAGVRTPALVHYDEVHPYLLLERVHHGDLAGLDADPADAQGVYRGLGRTLAHLHSQAQTDAGELAGRPDLRDDAGFEPRRLIDALVASGQLNAGQGRWLLAWFDHLEPFRPADPPFVLLHADAGPPNLLVDSAATRLEALIDWGKAAWGDPARDFVNVPLRAVPFVLAGYRELAPSGDWEARALWYQLFWALARARKTGPHPPNRNWAAPTLSRLLEILRFFAAAPPGPWPSLAVRP